MWCCQYYRVFVPFSWVIIMCEFVHLDCVKFSVQCVCMLYDGILLVEILKCKHWIFKWNFMREKCNASSRDTNQIISPNCPFTTSRITVMRLWKKSFELRTTAVDALFRATVFRQLFKFLVKKGIHKIHLSSIQQSDANTISNCVRLSFAFLLCSNMSSEHHIMGTSAN